MFVFGEKLVLDWMAEGDHGGDGGSGGDGGDGGTGDNNGGGTGGDGTGGDGGTGGDDGGDSSPEWLGGLTSDELKGHESLKGIKSVEDLAQGYLDLQGKQAVVPESADGYELTLPEGQQMSAGELGGIRQAFHDAGVPVEASKKLFASILADRAAVEQRKADAVVQMREASLQSLKKDWGAKTKENIERANQAVVKVFGQDFSDFMKKTGLADNDLFIRGAYDIATKIGEDSFERNGGAGDTRKRDTAGQPLFEFKSMS